MPADRDEREKRTQQALDTAKALRKRAAAARDQAIDAIKHSEELMVDTEPHSRSTRTQLPPLIR